MEQTINKMRHMRLSGMCRAIESDLENGIFYTEDTQRTIAQLTDYEWDDRYNRKIERLIKAASFPSRASIEEIKYDPERNLNQGLINHLASCDYIAQKQNILITGATGAGKSYLATALGQQACIQQYKVKYYNCNKLFAKLQLSKIENQYLKELRKLETSKLLILDDFGLQQLEKQDRIALLEIIEDRQEKGSVIISSQLPVSKWFDIIGDKTIADAILDRLVHHAVRIELQGESMRKKIKK